MGQPEEGVVVKGYFVAELGSLEVEGWPEEGWGLGWPLAGG